MSEAAEDLHVALDRSVRQGPEDTLIGGSPRVLLRLSPAGLAALAVILEGGTPTPESLALGRRFVAAGLAHPRHRRRQPAGAVTIVIPVRDRPRQLERCLLALERDVNVIVVDDGSQDPGEVAVITARHHARMIRRSRPGGPAAARNAGLSAVDTELVAFIDSDCVPSPDWLAALIGHFDDPGVAAVAPRIRALRAGDGALQRYLRSRSPLDMGAHEAAVNPSGSVRYVPSAAMVVRRCCLADGFDESLRYGEDVDLSWRLVDAGWTIRYVPAVEVAHEEPISFGRILGRRLRYGASAAPLAAQHPGRLAPALLHWAPTGGVLLLVSGRRRAAAVLLGVGALVSLEATRGLGLPSSLRARWFGAASIATTLSLGRYAGTVALPLTIVLARRRGLPGAAVLLALPAVREWAGKGHELDVLRWSALAAADDASYAAGVWWGCLRARTIRPLLPKLVGFARLVRRRPARDGHPGAGSIESFQ